MWPRCCCLNSRFWKMMLWCRTQRAERMLLWELSKILSNDYQSAAELISATTWTLPSTVVTLTSTMVTLTSTVVTLDAPKLITCQSDLPSHHWELLLSSHSVSHTAYYTLCHAFFFCGLSQNSNKCYLCLAEFQVTKSLLEMIVSYT